MKKKMLKHSFINIFKPVFNFLNVPQIKPKYLKDYCTPFIDILQW
jgi:hypothetical protein